MDKKQVYFVGAGPGAADLITVRGAKLIGDADVVIYAGSLVNPELLNYAREGAEIHNSAYMTLGEVLDVMKSAAADNKTVIRLHTGDPSLYGAVREQMDALDELGITYESCPGVSAAFGAAASMDLEYTLPGLSQSLVITRMAGRTAVPEKESIESWAAHGATMAIYLSTGMLEELSRRLVAGGYKEDTPAAIIYKATWPDEEFYFCRIADLAAVAAEHGITKTALILVGDAIGRSGYEKSKLYDETFSTEFRKAKRQLMRIKIIYFTDKGKTLSERLKAGLAEHDAVIVPKGAPLGIVCGDAFVDNEALVFVGAAGIAVRAIAPLVRDKLKDPPVIVIDEKGTFVIPLLSGHVGGANSLAMEVADIIGAQPVITTATDVSGAFSVDVFAKENELKIANRDGIARVSSSALEGKPVTICIKDYPPEEPVDVLIADEEAAKVLKDSAKIVLCPKRYAIGMGCRRGKSFEALRAFAEEVLDDNGIDISDAGCISTIDVKKDEEGLKRLSQAWRMPLITFEAGLLAKAEGDFSHSDTVLEKVGVDNVCERAAVLAAGKGSQLIIKKAIRDGMTIAVAERRM